MIRYRYCTPYRLEIYGIQYHTSTTVFGTLVPCVLGFWAQTSSVVQIKHIPWYGNMVLPWSRFCSYKLSVIPSNDHRHHLKSRSKVPAYRHQHPCLGTSYRVAAKQLTCMCTVLLAHNPNKSWPYLSDSLPEHSEWTSSSLYGSINQSTL